jgi:hypothetical protein
MKGKIAMPDIDLSQYYTSEEAANVLSKKRGKKVDPSYVRMLVKYGRISQVKVRARFSVYPREEIDGYIIEARGVKSSLAAKSKAAAIK